MEEPQSRFFCFDLASPSCYLAAERILQVLEAPVEWLPVSAAGLKDADQIPDCARSQQELARRAKDLGLLPMRWPQPYPFDSTLAMSVATYAKEIGKTVAFAQAAFRQAFAGGNPLDRQDTVLIAAAACEMHPKAVLRAIGSASVAKRLREATACARACGVREVPSVVLDGEILTGEEVLALIGEHGAL